MSEKFDSGTQKEDEDASNNEDGNVKIGKVQAKEMSKETDDKEKKQDEMKDKKEEEIVEEEEVVMEKEEVVEEE